MMGVRFSLSALMLKILVVDDNESIRELLRVALAGPYTVYTAPSVSHAKHILTTKHVDIIFLDVWLNGRDGTELLSWVEKKNLECRTILITGDDVYDYNHVKNMVDHILIKPFDLADVLQIASTALEKKLENFSNDHL